MNKKILSLVIALVFILSQTTVGFAQSVKASDNKPMTRSAFIVLLHKALDIQIQYFKAPDIKEFYSDVQNSASYANNLYDLATLGIVDFEGKFLPNQLLTKEEMIHMAMAGYKYKLGDKFMAIKIAHKLYKDENKLNPVYQGDMVRAEYLKLVSRTKANMILPKDKVTKTQATALLVKLSSLIEKETAVLKVTPSLEKTADGLVMKLTIRNDSKQAMNLHHASGQKYDFQLFDSQDQNLYTWSADKSFIMTESDTLIKAGSTLVFTELLPKEVETAQLSKIAYMKGYILCQVYTYGISEAGYMAVLK